MAAHLTAAPSVEQYRQTALPAQLLVKLPVAAEILSIGQTTLEELIRLGVLRSVRIKTCHRIRVSDLEAFVGDLDPSTEAAS